MATYGDRGSSGKSLVVAAPMVVATTTGMVTMNTENVCKGHDGEWLNATQLKRLLNRDPGPLERPSVLNALAFRCSSKDCEERPCAQKLDEYNLYTRTCYASHHFVLLQNRLLNFFLS